MQNRNPVIAKVLNVLVFLFLYLPIAVLIIFSFNDSKSRTVWSGFSLHWYQELFQDEEILSAFSTTLTVSVLAALIATVLGTAAAIGFHAMKRRPRHLLMTINNIPMTNADIITGVSLMLLFVFLHLQNTPFKKTDSSAQKLYRRLSAFPAFLPTQKKPCVLLLH